MTIMKTFILASTLSVACVVGQTPFDGTSMVANERAAFQAVARQCASDVDYYCFTDNQIGPAFSSLPRFAAMTSMDDEVDYFSGMIDSFLEDTLGLPPVTVTTLLLFPIEYSSPQSPPSSPETHLAPEEIAANTIVSHIAAHTDSHAMEKVSERVQTHGNALLKDESVSADKRRMARRLTELATPRTLQERRQEFLPFGSRNRCLINAYDKGRVTNSCGQAIDRLRQVRMTQYQQLVAQQKETQFVFEQISALYFFLTITLVVMFWRRRDKRQKQLLRFNIIRAVYSKPTLKAALEKEIGESLGHVPPFSFRTLVRFGQHGQNARSWSKMATLVRRLCLLLSVVMLWVAPLWFLPLCVLVSVVNCWMVTFTQPPAPVCTCCACGTSTDAAAQGGLTEEQLTCDCCKGTGVCSVKCEGCGTVETCLDTDDSQTCHDDYHMSKADGLFYSKEFVYRGVPVQIV